MRSTYHTSFCVTVMVLVSLPSPFCKVWGDRMQTPFSRQVTSGPSSRTPWSNSKVGAGVSQTQRGALSGGQSSNVSSCHDLTHLPGRRKGSSPPRSFTFT